MPSVGTFATWPEDGEYHRGHEGIEDEPGGAEDGLFVLRGELPVDQEHEEIAIFPELGPIDPQPSLVWLDDGFVGNERVRGQLGTRASGGDVLDVHGLVEVTDSIWGWNLPIESVICREVV